MLDFPTVLSYHFQETPENMMEILSELTILIQNLLRLRWIATEQDVLDLMNYTRGFKKKKSNPEQEYVTIG